MPDWKDRALALREVRRRELAYQLGSERTFGIEFLPKTLSPFRLRRPGERLTAYNDAKNVYFTKNLERKWKKYIGTVEGTVAHALEVQGATGLSRSVSAGLVDLPVQLIGNDFYEIGFVSALEELGLFESLASSSLSLMRRLENSLFNNAMQAGQQLTGSINDRVRHGVSTVVTESLREDGYTTKKFLERLREVAKIDDRVKALQISQTETTRAIAGATRELANAMQEAGYETIELWITERTARVCPDCEALEALGERLRETHQGDPPLHVNCACWIKLLVKDSDGNII
ncbi:MAG: hypothetical protein DRP42_07390 [Tenericutes bacterium]|nr:MAG: hypothetical protein DRP42_07390 [Mycoplasmatota bacterium]